MPDSHVVLVSATKKRKFSSAIPSHCCSATVDFFRTVLIAQCSELSWKVHLLLRVRLSNRFVAERRDC